MTLQEALIRGNGKAWRNGWEFGHYIETQSGCKGALTIFTQYSSFQWTPDYEEIMATDWEPYSPKPEKCKACGEIEEIKKVHGLLRTPDINNFIWHLQKHHCTCKEGK